MNSFGDILIRLRSSMAGDFSTIEGSFAGDILQAVACELARIYSQEIDTLRERAFVRSACGVWLDAACADFGVERKPEESDESLRIRTLTKVRAQASSGNEAHYRAWATELDGVSAAWVKGRLRGPGTVDVFIKPEGENADDTLLDEVFDHIETLRPVCADVRVSFAVPVPVGLRAHLILAAGATIESVTAQIEPAFKSFLNEIALTDRGTVLSLSRAAGMIMDCTGVLDARNVTLNGQGESLKLEPGQYAVPGECVFILAV